eukprot:Clim_evm70s108 gene=Clim_evmTU70s108
MVYVNGKLKESYPMFLASKPVTPNLDLAVTNKYNQEVATRVPKATKDHMEEAIAAATKAQEEFGKMPAYMRQQILWKVVAAIKERFEEFAIALAIEAGKPIKDARGETQRCIDTFTVAAEEATRINGEWMPLDISERAQGMQGIVRKFPNGPIGMVSPFNFPINLAAHKVAPALAAGCAFVLKPASYTPVSSIIMGEILAGIPELPEGAFSILPCSREAGTQLCTDPRLKVFSFTGSPDVGYKLLQQAGGKKCVLELGGNAGVIVDKDTDIEEAVARVIFGAYYQSGQSCISVQRIYAHKDIYEKFRDHMVQEIKKLKKGDPLDEDTFIGPIISENDAKNLENWTKKAEANGAKVLVGGTREGVFFDATLIETPSKDDEVMKEEAFGTLACIAPFESMEEVCREINDSKFGLQAGIFTKNLHNAFYCFENLDVGGVVVGDVPSLRVDSQPYGGVKQSGLGREGIRWAIQDYCEERIMLLKNVGIPSKVE